MSGDVIEIVDVYDPKKNLDYATKELITPEQTQELMHVMAREHLVLGLMERYRETFPDSPATDEQVRAHVEKIVDEREGA
jgi:hypothetical protein